MKVKDLKPKSNIDELELEIVSKGEVKQFANDRGSGKVCNCAAKDSDGDEVSLTLWNNDVDNINEGDKVIIKNGWTTEFNGQLQVGTGKFGSLEVVS